MAKKIKWWMKMSNWELVLYVLTPFTIGGSMAIHFSSLSNWWMIVIGVVDTVVGIMRFFAKDENHNNIVDRFEDKL